jgi:hypothetical protein
MTSGEAYRPAIDAHGGLEVLYRASIQITVQRLVWCDVDEEAKDTTEKRYAPDSSRRLQGPLWKKSDNLRCERLGGLAVVEVNPQKSIWPSGQHANDDLRWDAILGLKHRVRAKRLAVRGVALPTALGRRKRFFFLYSSDGSTCGRDRLFNNRWTERQRFREPRDGCTTVLILQIPIANGLHPAAGLCWVAVSESHPELLCIDTEARHVRRQEGSQG